MMTFAKNTNDIKPVYGGSPDYDTLVDHFFEALSVIQPSQQAATWALATVGAFVCDVCEVSPAEFADKIRRVQIEKDRKISVS